MWSFMYSLFLIILLKLTCRGVYSVVVTNYVGCFEDSAADRILNDYHIELANMSTQICNYICFQKGFQLAGTQKKKECFCGDLNRRKLPKAIDDTNCDEKTLIDMKPSQKVQLTLKVYRTGIEDDQDFQKKFLGCISEYDPNFMMPRHKMDFDQTNSPGRCLAACKSMGFKHAGLSQSTICYCGEANNIENTTGCDSPCPRQQSINCGGFAKTSLYATSIDPGITPIQVQMMGCFENRFGGLLYEYSETSTDMTVVKCIATCFQRSFHYAGLHKGDQCQCGYAPQPIPEEVAGVFCSTKPCSGNQSESCGSEKHVKGYSTSILGMHQLYGKSLGCFKDTNDTPREKIVQLPNNSPVNCVTHCMLNGFAFASVKKTECRCGNNMVGYNMENILSDSSCSSVCPDNSLTCGGDTAVAVYRTGLDFQAKESCSKSLTEVNGEQVCSGKLLFEDNFDTLNHTKWRRTVRISAEDYEFVTYSYDSANCFVKDGKLHIRPTVQTDDQYVRSGELSLVGCTGEKERCYQQAVSFRILPPVRSARLTTKHAFSFKYGVINIRAKLPQGDWIYPQIWLKPFNKTYGPAYRSGKLVMASSHGNYNLTTSSGEYIGSSRVQAGLIMGEVPKNYKSRMVSFREQQWSNDFHNYTFIWSPDSILMYVDGKKHEAKTIIDIESEKSFAAEAGFSKTDAEIWSSGSQSAPFDQPFYIALGLGVGGNTFFPDDCSSDDYVKPWSNYQVKAMLNFWKAKDHWLPTWSNNSDLILDYISVHALV